MSIRPTLIIASVFMSSLIGCASAPPPLSTRPIQTESTWFVRLDAEPHPDPARPSGHEHPLDWAESDIAAVLERLLLQRDTFLLEQHRSLEWVSSYGTPQRVFSTDEIMQLTPALHAAFLQAEAHEWVSFLYLQPSGSNLIVTSGGFLFQGGHLHVVLANHREKVHQYAVDIALVRKNPLRSIRGVDGRLMFDPQNLVIATMANWAGHSNNPASEIIIEHRSVPSSGVTLAPGDANSSDSGSSRPESEQTLHDQSAHIRRLEAQIEILTRQMQEQDVLLHKLRKELDTLTGSKQSTKPNSAQSP